MTWYVICAGFVYPKLVHYLQVKLYIIKYIIIYYVKCSKVTSKERSNIFEKLASAITMIYFNDIKEIIISIKSDSYTVLKASANHLFPDDRRKNEETRDWINL